MAGVDGEEGYDFPQRSQTPIDASQTGNERSVGPAISAKTSRSSTRARADALGDQTDEDDDENVEEPAQHVKSSLAVEEAHDRSIEGSVY